MHAASIVDEGVPAPVNQKMPRLKDPRPANPDIFKLHENFTVK